MGKYLVQKGDNLYKIAKRNKLTLNELLQLNPEIKDANRINVGQQIKIGKSSGSPNPYVSQDVDYGDLNAGHRKDYDLWRRKNGNQNKTVDEYKQYLAGEHKSWQSTADLGKKGAQLATGLAVGTLGATVAPKIAPAIGSVASNTGQYVVINAGKAAGNPAGTIGGITGSYIGGNAVNQATNDLSGGKYSGWGDMLNKGTNGFIPTWAGDLTNPGSFGGAYIGSAIGNAVASIPSVVTNANNSYAANLVNNANNTAYSLDRATHRMAGVNADGSMRPTTTYINQRAQPTYNQQGNHMNHVAGKAYQNNKIIPNPATPRQVIASAVPQPVNSYGYMPVFSNPNPDLIPFSPLQPAPQPEITPYRWEQVTNEQVKGDKEWEEWYGKQADSNGKVVKYPGGGPRKGWSGVIIRKNNPQNVRRVYAEDDQQGVKQPSPVLVPDSTSIGGSWQQGTRRLQGGVDQNAVRDLSNKLYKLGGKLKTK